MQFFFDRNFCARTARMLAIYEGASGHRLIHHDDDPRFHPRSKDVEIMRTLRNDDPNSVFVGGDGKILRNRVELATLAECDLMYVLLNHSWCTKKIEDTCWMMVKVWPRLTAEVGRLRIHSILELKYSSNCQIDNRGATADHRLR